MLADVTAMLMNKSGDCSLTANKTEKWHKNKQGSREQGRSNTHQRGSGTMTVGTWREWGDSSDSNDFIKTVSLQSKIFTP